MSLTGRVRQGLLWNQLGRALEYAAAYAASAVAARAFGPVTFGVWSVALSLVTLVTHAGALGFNEVLAVGLPRLARVAGQIAFLLQRLLRLRVAIALALAAALFLAAPAIARAWRTPALAPVIRAAALYGFFYQVSLLLEYFFVGRLEVPRATRVRVMVQFLHLAAAAATLRFHLPPRVLFLIMAGNSALGVAWLLATARGTLIQAPDRFPMLPVLQFGFAIWATNVVNFFVGRQADILLIGLFHPGTDAAGAYSAAALLAMLLAGALIMGAEGVSLAAFSEVEARADRGALGALWALHVKMDVLLSMPLLVFGAAFAGELVAHLYGAGYERAALLLRAYALIWIVARVLGGGTNIAVLYAMQSPRLPLAILGACGAWNLIGDLILIPRFGAWGAVGATGLAMIGAGLASGLVIHRRTGAFFPLGFALKVLAACVPATLLAARLPRPPGLLGLAVAGMIVAVVSLLGLRLLRPFGDDDRRVLVRLAPRLEWLITRL